jgi:hypothetical protein
MEAWLARREREGWSLRQLAEQSGIPIGTLSWWSYALRRERGQVGFTEVRAGERRMESSRVPKEAEPVICLRHPSGCSVEFQGAIAERVGAKLIELLERWC